MVIVNIDGKQLSGELYQFGDDILVRVKGMRPRGIQKWQALFDFVPEGVVSGGHLEVGEWHPEKDEFELDNDVSFRVDPYGQVIAFIGTVDDLPLIKED